MTEKPQSELKEYAGGWITERKGTGIPQMCIRDSLQGL